MNHARALQEEINNLKQKTHSSAKGHLGIEWTISTLENRVKEIKAKLAKKNIEEKYANLLLETNMEIFSYTNNENLLFHRVWTTSMNKDNGLKLCQKFKKEKIVCILQVNKKN